MDPFQLDTVVCDGYCVVFNSPIEFEVRKEPDNEFEWLVAEIPGFERQSQCLGENPEDLAFYISEMLVGTLQYPPAEDDDDEDYRLFFNYIKNSIETVTWSPPPSMEIVGSEEANEVELVFA